MKQQKCKQQWCREQTMGKDRGVYAVYCRSHGSAKLSSAVRMAKRRFSGAKIINAAPVEPPAQPVIRFHDGGIMVTEQGGWFRAYSTRNLE